MHLSELSFDLDYTASESDILFGMVLHSQQEISKTFCDRGREGLVNPVLLDGAVSGI